MKFTIMKKGIVLVIKPIIYGIILGLILLTIIALIKIIVIPQFIIEISKPIFTGVVLAIIGYFFWKKQNIYSKKFDVYINVLSSLSEIMDITFDSCVLYEEDGINYLTNRPTLKEFYTNNQNFFHELQKNKQLFVTYFGDKYKDEIEYFIYIDKVVDKVQYTFQDGHTKFFMPEEYTSSIINAHQQQVFDKMGIYYNDVKSVSTDLKKYVI
jgi:hypothetical protein